MAERYERQIGEQGPPNVYGQNFATPDSYGLGVAVASGQLGEQAERTANLLVSYKEKQDNIDVIAATNDYNRMMTSNLYDPETGQLVKRKLNDANGLLMDTETYADNVKKDVMSRLSKEAANKFDVAEVSLRQPFVNASAKHEAQERESFAKANANNALQGFIESAQADPFNFEMIRNSRMLGAAIISERMVGASQEMIDRAIKGWYSSIESARIGMFIHSDPLLAQQMIDESTDLLAGERAELEAKTKPEVDRVEVQGIVDDLGKKFGWEDLATVSKYVRENYEGERQDQIMNRYKTIFNELQIDRQNREESSERSRREYFKNNFYDTYTINGLPIPVDDLDNATREGKIGMTQREQGLDYNGKLATRSAIVSALKRKDPNTWNQMTDVQKEEAVMNAAGITQDRRDNALEYLKRAIADPNGTITATDIDSYKQSMLITESESALFKQILSKKTSEYNNAIKVQSDRMKNDIRALLPESAFLNDMNRKRYIDEAYTEFMEASYATQEQGLKGEDLYNYLNKSRQLIIGNIYKKILDDRTAMTGGNDEFYTNVTSMVERISRESPAERVPEFRSDPISLRRSFGDVSVPKNGSLAMSMVSDGKYISSGFNDSRDGGSRQHGAIDIAAPEGSAIFMSDFGTEMKIVNFGHSSSTGNMVELKGTLKDGKVVSVKMMHLKNLEGLSNGKVFNVGDHISFVGNTGSTSTGPHLHLEVSVNGQRVNPDSFLYEVANMRRQEQILHAEKSNSTEDETDVNPEQVASVPPEEPLPGSNINTDIVTPEEEDSIADDIGGISITQGDEEETLDSLANKVWGGIFGGGR